MLQSKFVVWSEGQGEKQLEVECGGGHRSWDCLHKGTSQGRQYHFVFIKSREVVLVTGSQKSNQCIVKVGLVVLT
jgi:hypothetical protein